MSEQNQAFAEDLFERKTFASNLLYIIKNQDEYESRVIAIKASFGEGKTFFAKDFLKFIDEENEKNSTNNKTGEKIILAHYVDIWKEDYINEPLLALLDCFNNMVDRYRNILEKNDTKEIIEKTKNFAKAAVKNIVKDALKEIPLIPFAKSIAEAIDTLDDINDKNIFANLKKYKTITQSIKKAFQNIKNNKIVIIIDEIDRCHPEYSIKFLENLKHFFDIKGLYFILMFNEEHLQDKLKEKFGYINFSQWKDKFIDLEFELPHGNYQKYIQHLLGKK